MICWRASSSGAGGGGGAVAGSPAIMTGSPPARIFNGESGVQPTAFATASRVSRLTRPPRSRAPRVRSVIPMAAAKDLTVGNPASWRAEAT